MNVKEINQLLKRAGVDRTASAKDMPGTRYACPSVTLNRGEFERASSLLVFAGIPGCGYDYSTQVQTLQVLGAKPACPLCGEMNRTFRLPHSPNKCGCKNCGHEWKDGDFCKPHWS